MKHFITYLEDRRLIARFQEGDGAAFDTLYAAYAGRVFAFALPLVGGCRADAEDLVQETFVAAFQAAGSFRGGSRILTWLLGIAHRRFRDGKRRSQPIFLSVDDEHDASDISSVSLEDAVISDIRYQQALALLDEPQRIAFILVAAQGLTHKEAAALLETPVATIKWRVAKAASRLRLTLSEEREEAVSCALF